MKEGGENTKSAGGDDRWNSLASDKGTYVYGPDGTLVPKDELDDIMAKREEEEYYRTHPEAAEHKAVDGAEAQQDDGYIEASESGNESGLYAEAAEKSSDKKIAGTTFEVTSGISKEAEFKRLTGEDWPGTKYYAESNGVDDDGYDNPIETWTIKEREDIKTPEEDKDKEKEPFVAKELKRIAELTGRDPDDPEVKKLNFVLRVEDYRNAYSIYEQASETSTDVKPEILEDLATTKRELEQAVYLYDDIFPMLDRDLANAEKSGDDKLRQQILNYRDNKIKELNGLDWIKIKFLVKDTKESEIYKTYQNNLLHNSKEELNESSFVERRNGTDGLYNEDHKINLYIDPKPHGLDLSIKPVQAQAEKTPAKPEPKPKEAQPNLGPSTDSENTKLNLERIADEYANEYRKELNAKREHELKAKREGEARAKEEYEAKAMNEAGTKWQNERLFKQGKEDLQAELREQAEYKELMAKSSEEKSEKRNLVGRIKGLIQRFSARIERNKNKIADLSDKIAEAQKKLSEINKEQQDDKIKNADLSGVIDKNFDGHDEIKSLLKSREDLTDDLRSVIDRTWNSLDKDTQKNVVIYMEKTKGNEQGKALRAYLKEIVSPNI